MQAWIAIKTYKDGYTVWHHKLYDSEKTAKTAFTQLSRDPDVESVQMVTLFYESDADDQWLEADFTILPPPKAPRKKKVEDE